MKRIGSLIVFCFYFGSFFSQLTENFSDGDFNNNPKWTGDTLEFIVNSDFKLQLNGPSNTDTSYLCVETGTLNFNADISWEFYIKLDFSPSNNNNVRYYLTSNNNNLKGYLEGYFIRVGENGSLDKLKLYRQDGLNTTLLGSSIHTSFGVNPEFRVRVNRDINGNWEVLSDSLGGNNFIYELGVSDNNHTFSTFTGLWCKHTSSNNENFFFENTNKSRYAPKAEFKLSQTLFKNNENKSELLTPFIKFIYAKNTNQENLPNINSGFFLDSKALSNKIISGDSFKPMRRDILIGSDYFFSKNRSKLNLSISKLYGLGNRFLKTSSYILNLPEPIQMKLSYKNGQNLNLYGALTKDTNDNYDYFSAGISKKFLNENYSSFNFIWIRDINSYIFENDEVRKIQFIENKNKFHINERTSFYTKVDYDLKNSNLSNLVLGIEYENPGLIFGIALIESNELDWFKLINENSFNEYNQESFRIYFELKGLGSLGRRINQYTEKNSIQ